MISFNQNRHFLDKILRRIGLIAVSISLLILVILFGSLIYTASSVFTSYEINIGKLNINNEKEAIIELQKFGKGMINRVDLFSVKAQELFLDKQAWLPASAKLDYALINSEFSSFNEKEIIFIDELVKKGLIRKTFNLNFFTNRESREPEIAGIATSFIGSVYTILVCLLASLPISVCAAIYLEEFAPKNIFTSILEVNINNLAAVPSIVFGLLGLSVLIVLFDFPRSASITAGLTLSMMVMPVMIISTRQAFRVIPKEIKQAALALGATKTQVILHHSLPLAIPGIMTGVILAISRALGETAPLIIIGMLAFIVDFPKNVFDPATVMPVQIFLWADSLEQSFQAKTSAAILFLLTILVLINLVAVKIRKKSEKRW